MPDFIPAASKTGISGSTLKIIAIAAMLIDHIGAVFLGTYEIPYYICRLIGRIAFPIFCFLLIEGFLHTKSLPKYCFRLALFALISEIPFDLAFNGTPFVWDSQNVFFTLLIGLLVISFMKYVNDKLPNQTEIRLLLRAAALVCGMLATDFLKTDYSDIGVLCIVFLYLLYGKRTTAMAVACVLLCFLSRLEITAFTTVFLVKNYNGKRGISLKYIFYIFYPLHLIILYLLHTNLT